MRRKDDILWKGILEDVFDDFIRFMSPESDEILDLEKGVAFLDKELEQVFPPESNQYSPKVVDKLVRVYTKSGREEWVLIHIEVQGKYHRDFASRMFTYFYRILDKYKKPITAYAIFTEASPIERDSFFESAFMGTSVRYTFNTYQIAQQSERLLWESNNPFAFVVLIARAAMQGKKLKDSEQRDEMLLNLKLTLAKQLLSNRIPKDKIRVLMNFLKFYVRFDNPYINIKFEQQVEILTERSTTMGIEELILDLAEKRGEKKGEIKGLKEGEKKGLKEGEKKGSEKKSHIVVENLIVKMGLSDEQAADLAEVSLDFVAKVRSSLGKN